MSTFQEFPKMMVHPAHEPAVVARVFPLGYKPREGEREIQGTTERFPPVTVNDADQQAQYEARGYHVQGSDAAAFAQVQAGGIPAHYTYSEYPKMIHVVDADGDKVEMIVHSEAEEHQMLGYNKRTEKATVEGLVHTDGTPVEFPVTVHAAKAPAKKKPAAKKKSSRPKGYVKKPITDHMKVTD